MSAKDLCTIDFIDQIIDAGVSVLKIEGRGRASERRARAARAAGGRPVAGGRT